MSVAQHAQRTHPNTAAEPPARHPPHTRLAITPPPCLSHFAVTPPERPLSFPPLTQTPSLQIPLLIPCCSYATVLTPLFSYAIVLSHNQNSHTIVIISHTPNCSPGASSDLSAGLQLSQHVELLGGVVNILDRLDCTPALQGFDDLVDLRLTQVGLHLDVTRPYACLGGGVLRSSGRV